ncbi:hypothetical protein E2C01_095025 [Portunus trituberculatus]|uniref:Uncharacterized protein n=1 Tax=Portunus trituberculatus TaxID=210409 RepID=A0A5B7JXQ5_PORTR|nr:hypothetical protein [Portunus trituberculatus]
MTSPRIDWTEFDQQRHTRTRRGGPPAAWAPPGLRYDHTMIRFTPPPIYRDQERGASVMLNCEPCGAAAISEHGGDGGGGGQEETWGRYIDDLKDIPGEEEGRGMYR